MVSQLRHFYPRSPCGERRGMINYIKTYRNFYPRSPCGERHSILCCDSKDGQFLSTLSLRRATAPSPPRREFYKISIHALLAESDHPIGVLITEIEDFYPRSPCGERLAGMSDKLIGSVISIHALLAESDIRNAEAVGKYIIFLSTLSLRRATACFVIAGTASAFLSTLSLRRATRPSDYCN